MSGVYRNQKFSTVSCFVEGSGDEGNKSGSGSSSDSDSNSSSSDGEIQCLF